MSSVPLTCKICPRRPVFSDISHLLTHIASKGHLSHYFKAQVRSSHDSSLLQQLQEYDSWYEHHQIERLLAQRMATKDARTRSLGAKRVAAPSNNQAETKRSKSTIAPTAKQENVFVDFDDTILIDPQLTDTDHQCITERPLPGFEHTGFVLDVESVNVGGPIRSANDQRDRNGGDEEGIRRIDQEQLSHVSRVRGKSHHDTADGIVSKGPSEEFCNATLDNDQSSFVHPCASQRQPTATSPSRQYSFRLPPSRRFQTKAKEYVGPSQSTQPKGPQWPGMAMFDSASPETQRKRNQKKEFTVLGQMEQDSLDIQQVEQIYFPDGSLKKERPITGNVESSSPVKAQSPRGKGRRGRRIALGEIDGNVARTTRAARRLQPTASVGRSGRSGRAILRHSRQITPTKAGVHGDDIFSPGGKDAGWILDNPNVKNHNKLSTYDVDNISAVNRYQQKTELKQSYITRSASSPSAEFAEHDSPSQISTGHLSIDHVQETIRPRAAVAPMHSSQLYQHRNESPTISDRVTQRYFSISETGTPRFFYQTPSVLNLGFLELQTTHGHILNPLNLRTSPP